MHIFIYVFVYSFIYTFIEITADCLLIVQVIMINYVLDTHSHTSLLRETRILQL